MFFTFLYTVSSTFNDILRELVKEIGGRNVLVTVGSAGAHKAYRVGFVVFCLLVLPQKLSLQTNEVSIKFCHTFDRHVKSLPWADK